MKQRKVPSVIETTSVSMGDGVTFNKTKQREGGTDKAEPLIYSTFKDATKRTKVTPKCWACIHPFQLQLTYGAWPEMDKLWELYIENIDTMSFDDLKHVLSEQHHEQIFKPLYDSLTRQGKSTEDALQWLPEDVGEHISIHMVNHKNMLRNDINVSCQRETVLNDLVYMVSAEDPTVVVDIDPAKMNLLLKIGDQKLRQLAQYKTYN